MTSVVPLRVLLLGASGTIGRATARALLDRGYQVVCPLRQHGSATATVNVSLHHQLLGAEIRWYDLFDVLSLRRDAFANEHFDVVVSCMASRTGTPKDAWRIDYQAHADVLRIAKESGVQHFVLLSAICVQKPLLAFQHAKLAFEKELMASGLTYSIVRPTAFFKSLSGQLDRVKQGKSFFIFGDGKQTACKPISDTDLADYVAGCIALENRHNCILPIGGPGLAITPREQGEYAFRLFGKTPRFTSVPLWLFDGIALLLGLLGKVWPPLAEKAELAKIGRYYASESMLVWDPLAQRYDADATPSHGTHSLFDAYDAWAQGDAMPERGDHAVF